MADSDKHQDEDGKDRFEISELFMAKCGANGWDRCFFGTISREKDAMERRQPAAATFAFRMTVAYGRGQKTSGRWATSSIP
jgi:hypothetical protein